MRDAVPCSSITAVSASVSVRKEFRDNVYPYICYRSFPEEKLRRHFRKAERFLSRLTDVDV